MKITRRTFLQIAAAAGVVGAAQGAEAASRKLIPYVVPPENMKPGVWTLFATTCRECPAGCGMQMRVVDGRPINAQGNPNHPVNRGGLCARGQSCVQGLYDPDRLKGPLRRGAQSASGGPLKQVKWADAIAEIGAKLSGAKGRVAILSGIETGTLADVISRFAASVGSDRALFYEPFNYESLTLAHEEVFGRREIPQYKLDDCRFIISFGADFLETWVSPVEFARQFAAARSLDRKDPARFVYVGPRLSMTAANADEFLMVPPGDELLVARAMLGPPLADSSELPIGVNRETVRRLAKEFAESPSSVALAGPVGPPQAVSPIATETAKVAAFLNHASGRFGSTASFERTHALSHAATSDEMRRFLDSIGPDDVVIVHNCNPVFTDPGAEAALKRAGTLVYLGTMRDETAALASWILPMDSPLESWGDYEPWTGIHGLMQPTIPRLYDTRHAGDIFISLAKAAGQNLPAATFEDWLSVRWESLRQKAAPGVSPDEFWKTSLRNSGCWEPPVAASVHVKPIITGSNAPVKETGAGLALWAWASPMLYDGRTANRGWMQEAPDPTSTIVWTSWADIHPKTAASLGVGEDDVVELKTTAGAVEVPARITEDVAEGVVALPFGQGHTAMGHLATGRGVNAFRLLVGTDAGLVTLRRTGAKRAPARSCTTQDQFGREIVQWVPLADVKEGRTRVADGFTLPMKQGYDPAKDVYPGQDYATHRWVMAVDLDRCTGCGACGVACYAENNIPVIGEEQVGRSRVMAWLRIVPYRDPEDARRVAFLPLMCQQCDSAPCEPVCPVFASVHNEEGLNAQVYNRCIGTRYCSNNCPYKVRRFNWLNVQWEEPLKLQLNPEVTVRERGVMEKCTFCIQRIRQAEHQAKREDRVVRDGEIIPACAQSCPTKAIVFGDLMDKDSAAAKITRGDPRRYHVLEELRTKPGVTYLQRVRRGTNT